MTKSHSGTWSGPKSTARILSLKKYLESSTGTYAIHVVSRTTVGAAVCALKSVIKDMLSLTVRELTSSVTVVTLADASALIGNYNNSQVNNHSQKSLLNSLMEERILFNQGTNHFSNLSNQLAVVKEIFLGNHGLSTLPLGMIMDS